MRILIALALAFTLAAAPVAAGKLYRCIGADGVVAFQQSACAGEQREAGVRTYQPEPDAPQSGWVSQQFSQPAHQAAPQATPRMATGVPRRTQPDINPMSAEAEMMRRAQHRAGTPEGRAINRALYGTGEPRLGAPPMPPPPPEPPPPVPTTVFDQYGRPYTRTPGSHMVLDQRTGRQCITNGSEIIRCL